MAGQRDPLRHDPRPTGPAHTARSVPLPPGGIPTIRPTAAPGRTLGDDFQITAGNALAAAELDVTPLLVDSDGSALILGPAAAHPTWLVRSLGLRRESRVEGAPVPSPATTRPSLKRLQNLYGRTAIDTGRGDESPDYTGRVVIIGFLGYSRAFGGGNVPVLQLQVYGGQYIYERPYCSLRSISRRRLADLSAYPRHSQPVSWADDEAIQAVNQSRNRSYLKDCPRVRGVIARG
jgi:hypothetical protein